MKVNKLPHNIKEIPGYPGYYVSSEGIVYSDHTRGRNGNRVNTLSIKHLTVKTSGYVTTVLYLNKKRYTIKVSRLVALTFIPNPEGLPEVNHLDFNRANNRANNLEWVTHSKNIKHSRLAGRFNKISLEQAIEIRSLRSEGLTCKELSIRYKVGKRLINRVLKNKANYE